MVRVIEWMGHVARIGETVNIQKPGRKRPLGRSRLRQKNISVDFEAIE
jgi:hypothetical protein